MAKFGRLVAGACGLAMLAAVTVAGSPTLGTAAEAVEVYDEVVEITFPLDPALARFSNDYDAPRGGGSRVHMATDIIAPKHSPAYAAADGTICYITGIDEPEPSWGYHLKICGEDGIEYDYIHINNDTPGTDDGLGGPEHAYAPGIRRGARVVAGQLVAWVGDSGNAENTVSHIHFEMEHPDVTSPYSTQRMNPYPSLIAALEAGRVSDGTVVFTDPKGRIAGPDRVATALAVADAGFQRASTVVLARADLPWPAIVAGPLAAVHGGPVLTTAPGELDERVRTRLDELNAETVYVVGPLDFDLATALEGLDVTQAILLDGGNRYATSAMVAELVWEGTGAVRAGEEPVELPEPEPTVAIDGTRLEYADDLNDLEELMLGFRDGWLGADDLADDARGAISQLDQSGPTLLVMANDRRTDAHFLDGAVISEDFAVQLFGADPRDVDRVAFWYDTTDPEQRRNHTERFSPYDAPGTDDDRLQLFSADDWGTGEHVIMAEIRYANGDRDRIVAEFEITGAGAHRAPRVETREAILALGDHPVESRSWPDALMASYYGSARYIPVLLTPPDMADTATATALDGVETTWVIGGPGAISDTILTDLAFVSGASFERLAGTSRYWTALAVVDDLVARDLVSAGEVWVATGHNWPDATAAGPVIARAGDVMLLVNGSGAGGDEASHAWLAERADEIERITALGGPAAVASDVLTQAAVSIT